MTWSETHPLDGPVSTLVDLRGVLSRAADALHDAAWVMNGAPTEPPLPPPVTLVLPQTKRVEAEVRALIAALDEEVARG
jgi:hypothetical protein